MIELIIQGVLLLGGVGGSFYWWFSEVRKLPEDYKEDHNDG